MQGLRQNFWVLLLLAVVWFADGLRASGCCGHRALGPIDAAARATTAAVKGQPASEMPSAPRSHGCDAGCTGCGCGCMHRDPPVPAAPSALPGPSGPIVPELVAMTIGARTSLPWEAATADGERGLSRGPPGFPSSCRGGIVRHQAVLPLRI